MATESKNTDFHILTPPNADVTRSQIAVQCELSPVDVKDNEVRVLYAYHVGSKKLGVPSDLVEKYLVQDDTLMSNRLAGISQRAEVLFDESLYGMSYGVGMPDYLRELQKHKESSGNIPTGHNAVLLGALSLDSAREFAVTVRSVYPDANCTVIDNDPRASSSLVGESANFVFGDAQHLPFASDTVDSLHADYLLRFMSRYSKQDKPNHNMLFSEAYRALRPGGILILKEPLSDADNYLEELHRTGFSSVGIRPSTEFKSRTDMEKFMRSTTNKFLGSATCRSDYAATIVAKKSQPIAG